MYNLKQAKRDIASIYATGLFEDVNITPNESDSSSEAAPRVSSCSVQATSVLLLLPGCKCCAAALSFEAGGIEALQNILPLPSGMPSKLLNATIGEAATPKARFSPSKYPHADTKSAGKLLKCTRGPARQPTSRVCAPTADFQQLWGAHLEDKMQITAITCGHCHECLFWGSCHEKNEANNDFSQALKGW